LEYSVLDPTITHSVAERQLTTILFGSHSPTVITGDDNGTVSVFKICKGGLTNTAEDELEITDNGIISPVNQQPSQHDEQQHWNTTEAQRLQEIVLSKLTANTVQG
jgi:hypothetical protein